MFLGIDSLVRFCIFLNFVYLQFLVPCIFEYYPFLTKTKRNKTKTKTLSADSHAILVADLEMWFACKFC